MKRPKTLVAALLLLAAAHVYGIVQIVSLIQAGVAGAEPLLLVVVTAGVYAFLLGLLGLAALGRDWARFLGAIVALLALLENAPHLPSFGLFALAWFAAKLCGLVLLYAPPSNRWFQQVAPNNSRMDSPHKSPSSAD